jgi:putative GTP pyrophosphokinase
MCVNQGGAVYSELDRDHFLQRYRPTQADLRRAKLKWADLQAIHADHIAREHELLAAANYVRDRLQEVPAVHSLKVRVKHPEHLLEKIVRKRLERPARGLSLRTYRERVTDLVGVRALHLFKADWGQIHNAITGTWACHETPVANIRRGDPDQVFRDAGCRVKQHPAGYRSVHYLVRHQPARIPQLVEVQVRTIFEEGWSEIDHRIRYPHNTDDEVLSQFLGIFNGLAGSADHMGSYINFLAEQMNVLREERALETAQKKKLRGEVKRLRADVAKLKIDTKDKERINQRVRAVTARTSHVAPTASIAEAIDRVRTQISQLYNPETSELSRAMMASNISELARRPLPMSEIEKIVSSHAQRAK